VGFGALLLGVYRNGKLVYAGKVGTGVDNETLRALSRRLAQLETPTCPFAEYGLPRCRVHWVKPKLVAQIEFGSRNGLRNVGCGMPFFWTAHRQVCRPSAP
jgi:ATP-dependent DNA ligase